MMLAPYTCRGATCAGCPYCSETMANTLRMDAQNYSTWLQERKCAEDSMQESPACRAKEVRVIKTQTCSCHRAAAADDEVVPAPPSLRDAVVAYRKAQRPASRMDNGLVLVPSAGTNLHGVPDPPTLAPARRW